MSEHFDKAVEAAARSLGGEMGRVSAIYSWRAGSALTAALPHLAAHLATDPEVVERVADTVGPRIDIRCSHCAGRGLDPRSNLDCTSCEATGYQIRAQPWREREARELAAEVLAALSPDTGHDI